MKKHLIAHSKYFMGIIVHFPACGRRSKDRFEVISSNCLHEKLFRDYMQTHPDNVCKKCAKTLKP